MSDLLSFIISNTDKQEFSSIWKWIRCCNDVMNHLDSVIVIVYPQTRGPSWSYIAHLSTKQYRLTMKVNTK